VRAFKTFSARRVNAFRDTQGASVWQRSFYDRIIRNERELNAIRQYIANNPAQWEVDRENPHHRR
jgi:REP element-mobilizing transposase RayT